MGDIDALKGFENFKQGLETSRRRLLDAVKGSSDVTFITGGANTGDYLIWAGLRKLFNDGGIRFKEDTHGNARNLKGELAVLAGCGDWCHAYHFAMPLILPKVEMNFDRVVVMPSSFDISLDLVRNVLSSASDRVKVFARERESYRQIRNICNADIAYDTAFFFDYAPYKAPGKGVLKAYRVDHESLLKARPSDNEDISAIYRNLDDWLRKIAKYEIVKTDRAHVMIAAAMLGKKVYYKPSNYHKVPGIAEFSLKDFPVYPDKGEVS